MSFKVFLGALSKRENSTERLGTADMTEYSCVILRGSGVLNPKIELDFSEDILEEEKEKIINLFNQIYMKLDVNPD